MEELIFLEGSPEGRLQHLIISVPVVFGILSMRSPEINEIMEGVKRIEPVIFAFGAKIPEGMGKNENDKC